MTKEDFIAIELPMWPSTNWLFATVYKDRYWKPLKKPIRIKSEEYENWLILAEIEYRKNKKYTITGDKWLQAELNYFFPIYNKNGTKKVKDTANYEKAIIDFLCTKIKWLEDHKIKRIVQEKHDSKKNIAKILIKEI